MTRTGMQINFFHSLLRFVFVTSKNVNEVLFLFILWSAQSSVLLCTDERNHYDEFLIISHCLLTVMGKLLTSGNEKTEVFFQKMWKKKLALKMFHFTRLSVFWSSPKNVMFKSSSGYINLTYLLILLLVWHFYVLWLFKKHFQSLWL